MHLVEKGKLKVDIFAAVGQIDVDVLIFEETSLNKVSYGLPDDN